MSFTKFEKSKLKRYVAFYLAINLIFETVSPSVALALTSGPAQEEFASFEPASTSEMVDVYSGDFTYNIPLLSVPGPNGGYPINIAYHSGIGMEQEASWVGLGWSLNVGAINRQMRGLPDDYAQNVNKIQHLKETWTVALDIPKTKSQYQEFAGVPQGGGSGNGWQVYYNNYRGMGMRYSYNLKYPTGDNNETSMNLGVTVDSQNGIGINLGFNASSSFKSSAFNGGFGLGASFNSRAGLQGFNFSSSASVGMSPEKATQKAKDSEKEQKDLYDKTGKMEPRSEAMTSVTGNSSGSFASSFSVPQTNMEMKATHVPFNLKFGKAASMFKFNARFPLMWSGSVYTSQLQHDGIDNVLGYGYLYTGSNLSDDVMKDFNRKEIPYSKKIPHLGTSSFTYDLYTQSGQGTGGMFRPHLNSFGILHDPQKTSTDRTTNLGLEVGAGTGGTPPGVDVHVGVDFELGSGQSSSGPWTQIKNNPDVGSSLGRELKNWSSSNNNIDYENYYFQMIGEKSGEHAIDNQLNQFAGDKAVRLKLSKDKHDDTWLNRHFIAEDNLINSETGATLASLNGTNQTNQTSSKKRVKRATSIEPLTTTAASQYGYSKSLKYKDPSNTLVAKDFSKPSSHLSEISSVQPDGMRYVYGLPAYNNMQIDNCFAVKAPNANFNTDEIAINTSGSTIGGVNVAGTYDEFVSKNQMESYIHSWLLTSVLSTDYIDMTGDGPSDDDYGYWVKFNYKKVASDYKWRAPYSKANFMEGSKNNPNDDKASYTYGTKEIYIVESIETKTHIAFFETSDRRDAIEALGEFSNGGVGTQKMKRLDKIKLYTKREYAAGGAPTKVVNFDYTYDLCPGVPNSTAGGKLTLTKIYFTYRNSTRGTLSPYIFNYGNLSSAQDNPSYNKRNMDRWGNFKNNSGNYSGSGNKYPYVDFPYTDQDASAYTGAQGLKAAPWTLKQIQLPSGGIMNIDYDFDDYAYVENKRAVRMFDIVALGQNPVQLAVNRTTGPNFASTEPKDYYVWIKLESTVANASEFREKYLDNIPGNTVYFCTYSDLKSGIYDYVKGYAEIDYNNYGIDNTGNYGYFTLKPKPLAQLNITGIKVSPFTRAAMEHLRANRSELISNAVPYASGASQQIMNLLGSFIPLTGDLMSMSIGFNNFAFANGWGKTIRLNGYSVVRLCDPDYSKKGGGVRVKKITLDDQWKNDPSSPASQNSLYGLSYDYTRKATINGTEKTISSGVAYEPQVGGEESALRTPIPYTNSIPLHGSYHLYLDNPIMEDYYPGAQVGYSKVTVKSIAPDLADIDDDAVSNNSNTLKSTGAPITVYEFYTPKDFPVIFDKTDMNPGQPIKQPLMIPGVYSGVRRRQAKSQGYSVITNDMAGKPKATTVYTKDGSKVLSRQEIIYNTEKPYSENSINRLSSKVQTLELDNAYNVKYVTSIIGQEHDIFIDMDEDNETSKSFGLNVNFDLHYSPTAFISFFIMPLPSISTSDNNMRTVVFNKVINRTGIVKKVISTTDQSTLISENLAYDIETGEALVSKTTNEFKDAVYSFSYPGHWYYPAMKGSYRNVGLKIDPPGGSVITTGSGGAVDVTAYLPSGSNVSDYFAKGDVVYINSSNNSYDGNYTVFSINTATDELYLINNLGEFMNASVPVESVKVIRSGFKNMLSTKVGGIKFKDMDPSFKNYDPQNDAGTKQDNPASITIDATNNKIINASAIEYSNDWQIFGGTAAPTTTACQCYVSQLATDYMNMVINLSSSGKIYSKSLPVYDVASSTYYYGFSPSILGGSNKLTQILASFPSGTGGIKYSGEIQSNGDLKMYFHSYSINYICPTCLNKESACKVILKKPTGYSGSIWDKVQSVISIVPKPSGPGCSVPDDLEVTLQLKDVSSPVTILLHAEACVGTSCVDDCWNFYDGCNTVSTPNYACGVNVGDPVNPYLAGMKGIWRPKATYAYNTDRTQANNVRTDGTFTQFNRFPWENVATKDAKWINAQTITKYSPYGYELENKNALGLYSSALYGYKHSLVVAIGSNARYNEIAADNFEDYTLDCNENHFKFSSSQSSVKSFFAHTGKYSIQVNAGTNLSVNKPVATSCNFTGIPDAAPPVPQAYGSYPVGVDHIINQCDLLGEFNPEVSKKYVASVWVKQVSSSNQPIAGLTDYTAPQLKITVSTSGSPVVYTFQAKGNVIDGWQRISEEFTIPANATGVLVELINSSGSGHITYFDDIRLHPFDANMVSYVYDPVTLKVVAELDANNYATIYTYDDEGHLNNVKKETAEGVKTVKEGRINTKKINE